MRPIHGTMPAKVHFGHLNQWLKLLYKSEWMIADDFARAAMGSDLRWDYLCLYYSLSNKHGRVRKVDTFGIGFEGVVSEEIINGCIHAQTLQNIDQLPTHWPDFWVEYRELARRWEAFCETVAQKEALEPVTPKPTPVEPAPVVVPAPVKVPEIAKQWWDCPKCGDHNPPLRENCIKCRGKRPGVETPVVQKPDSETPVVQKPSTPVKTSFKWIGLVASALIASYWLWSSFIPAPIGGIIKAVLQIIAGLF